MYAWYKIIVAQQYGIFKPYFTAVARIDHMILLLTVKMNLKRDNTEKHEIQAFPKMLFSLKYNLVLYDFVHISKKSDCDK